MGWDHLQQGGGGGGLGMAAMFGPGGPIILPWTVWGDRFSGGTVHGMTDALLTEMAPITPYRGVNTPLSSFL